MGIFLYLHENNEEFNRCLTSNGEGVEYTTEHYDEVSPNLFYLLIVFILPSFSENTIVSGQTIFLLLD